MQERFGVPHMQLSDELDIGFGWQRGTSYIACNWGGGHRNYCLTMTIYKTGLMTIEPHSDSTLDAFHDGYHKYFCKLKDNAHTAR